MSIRSLSDTNSAYDDGRFHVQRFYKANNTAVADGRWIDWAYAAGQPAYDSRIGTAGKFNPYVAARNDAIWFPDIPSGMHRHMKRIVLRTQASGTNQATTDAILYDLLGVYPLIDGDSTDAQDFTNDDPLPRYADGVGIFPVLVNHVAPALDAATGTMVYDDHTGTERTTPIGVSLAVQNTVASQYGGTTSIGALSLPLAGGSLGARRVKSIQFNTAPGGLFAIYMLKPITTVMNCDGGLVAEKIATEKFMALQNGWHYPRIYDGAHLGFFIRPNGGSRTIASVYGYLEFIWG